MTSIHEITSKPPSSFFLAVVELEGSSIVGIVDDPVGIDLSAVRLGYPIEFVQRWDNGKVSQKLIVPECGVPDEMVIDAGSVSVHMGSSPFGLTYFQNLQELGRIRPPIYDIQKISRTDANKWGNGNGIRERAQGL